MKHKMMVSEITLGSRLFYGYSALYRHRKC